MKTLEATVGEQGEITLPAEISRLLGLKAGDRAVILVPDEDDGRGVRVVGSAVRALRGIVPHLGRELSPQDMNRILEEELVANYLEEMGERKAARE